MLTSIWKSEIEFDYKYTLRTILMFTSLYLCIRNFAITIEEKWLKNSKIRRKKLGVKRVKMELTAKIIKKRELNQSYRKARLRNQSEENNQFQIQLC